MLHESFFTRPKVVQIWVHEDDKLNVLIHPSVFKGKIFLRFTKCNQVMLFRVYFNPYIMVHADQANTNTFTNISTHIHTRRRPVYGCHLYKIGYWQSAHF